MEQALAKYISQYLRDQRDLSPADAPIRDVLTIMDELPIVFEDDGGAYLSVEMERTQYNDQQTHTDSTVLFSIYLHQFTSSGFPTAEGNYTSVFVKRKAKEILTGRYCSGDEWSILNLFKKLTSQSQCSNGNIVDPGNPPTTPACVLANKAYVDSIDWDVPSASIDGLKYVSRMNCVAFIGDIKYLGL